MTTLKAAATLGNNSPSRILLTSKIFLEVAAEVCHSNTTHNLLSIFLKTWLRFSKTINFKSKPDWGNAAEEIFLGEMKSVNHLLVFLWVEITNQLEGIMEKMISFERGIITFLAHSFIAGTVFLSLGRLKGGVTNLGASSSTIIRSHSHTNLLVFFQSSPFMSTIPKVFKPFFCIAAGKNPKRFDWNGCNNRDSGVTDQNLWSDRGLWSELSWWDPSPSRKWLAPSHTKRRQTCDLWVRCNEIGRSL